MPPDQFAIFLRDLTGPAWLLAAEQIFKQRPIVDERLTEIFRTCLTARLSAYDVPGSAIVGDDAWVVD